MRERGRADISIRIGQASSTEEKEEGVGSRGNKD